MALAAQNQQSAQDASEDQEIQITPKTQSPAGIPSYISIMMSPERKLFKGLRTTEEWWQELPGTVMAEFLFDEEDTCLGIMGNYVLNLPGAYFSDPRVFKRLHKFILEGTQVETLPPEIFGEKVTSPTFLMYLECRNNRLVELPPKIGYCETLLYLICPGNRLKALPSFMGFCINLKHLDCSNNQLTELPVTLGVLPDLKYLDCSNNQLTTFPSSFAQNGTLEDLNFSGNNIDVFPSIFDISPIKRGCFSLKVLNCSGNQLTKLPIELILCSKLENFDCSHNRLEQFPKVLRCLRSLRHLDCSHNELKKLPSIMGSEFAKMCDGSVRYQRWSLRLRPPLIALDCSHNQLENLPNRIEYLDTLEVLDCHHNHLTRLPGEPDDAECADAECADAEAHRPKWAGLELLDCSNNQLTESPNLVRDGLEIIHDKV